VIDPIVVLHREKTLTILLPATVTTVGVETPVVTTEEEQITITVAILLDIPHTILIPTRIQITVVTITAKIQIVRSAKGEEVKAAMSRS